MIASIHFTKFQKIIINVLNNAFVLILLSHTKYYFLDMYDAIFLNLTHKKQE